MVEADARGDAGIAVLKIEKVLTGAGHGGVVHIEIVDIEVVHIEAVHIEARIKVSGIPAIQTAAAHIEVAHIEVAHIAVVVGNHVEYTAVVLEEVLLNLAADMKEEHTVHTLVRIGFGLVQLLQDPHFVNQRYFHLE